MCEFCVGCRSSFKSKTPASVSQLLFDRIFVKNFNSFSVATEIQRLKARFSCCESIGLYICQYNERTDVILFVQTLHTRGMLAPG